MICSVDLTRVVFKGQIVLDMPNLDEVCFKFEIFWAKLFRLSWLTLEFVRAMVDL
jgi:hypothetical protein